MKNLRIIKQVLLLIIVLSSVIEILVFPSIGNLVGIFVTWMSFVVYSKYIIIPSFIRNYPLLVFVSIIVFCLMYLPMPVTLMDGQSMSHDLYNPELTFILQFIYFSIFICSIRSAAFLSNKLTFLNKLFDRCGVFKKPMVYQTYILALIGWFFQYKILLSQFSGKGNYEPLIGTYKIFSVFIYSPIIILFYDLLGGKRCSKRVEIIAYFYLLFVSVALIATNSRGAILSGLMTFAGCFVIKCFTTRKKYKWLSVKNMLFGIVLAYIITGPLNDLAFAMLIARGSRTKMDYKELFSETLDYFNNKQLLNDYRKLIDSQSEMQSESDWNESYVSNVFLQRLCNYRVVDASIYHAFRAGIPNERMSDAFGKFIMAGYPQPILNIINADFKKDDYDYSSMDLLYSISNHQTLLKSYVVGGDVGLGISMFGFFYFIFEYFVYVIELFVITSFVKSSRNSKVFSLITLIGMANLFMTYQVGIGFVGHVQFVIWSCWWTLFWRLFVYRIVLLIKI